MSAPDEAVAAHIFDALDHHGDYFREHCWEIYEALRKRCPVTHSTAWDGFWIFVDYDDVYEAEQNTELFSSLKDKQVPKTEAPTRFRPSTPIRLNYSSTARSRCPSSRRRPQRISNPPSG